MILWGSDHFPDLASVFVIPGRIHDHRGQELVHPHLMGHSLCEARLAVLGLRRETRLEGTFPAAGGKGLQHASLVGTGEIDSSTLRKFQAL